MSYPSVKLRRYGCGRVTTRTGFQKSERQKHNELRKRSKTKQWNRRHSDEKVSLNGKKGGQDRKAGKGEKQPVEVLTIDVNRTPNSCIVAIGKKRWRALVDSGADVSVMSEKMYQRLKPKSKLRQVSQVLQGAGGRPLKVKGVTELAFSLGKQHFLQTCYVISDASRNLILGVDFLKKHKARIYFDLEKLRLNGEYVDLDQDVHIASVVRIAADITLPPKLSET